MNLFELAALAAASCWALASIISSRPAQHLGAVSFNHLRLSLVFAMLLVVVLLTGRYSSVRSEHLLPIILSGFIGFFIGDSLLFQCLNRLGPRRMSILFATNAPMATLLGWYFLDETLAPLTLLGIGLVMSGVLLAIVYGKRPSQLHQWETVTGPLWAGVGLGLLAALAQAVGSLIARPVMADGADPVFVSMLRLGVAALSMTVLFLLPLKQFKPKNKPTLGIIGQTALSGFIAVGVGVTLLMFALSGGEVGIISTLSATSPALLLPLLWLRTGERPAWGAWAGAALAIIGSGLIFMT